MIHWLLEGDPVIQYQVKRDLYGQEDPSLKELMKTQGWVKAYFDAQGADGHFGQGFYEPKWTSSHYSLLDLANFSAPQTSRLIELLKKIVEEERGPDKGINPSNGTSASDVCINGMFLNYACHFRLDQDELKAIVDFLLAQVMPDGGFNCRLNRSGASHSSMHTTICVLEGFQRYQDQGYDYRIEEIKAVQRSCEDFLLTHRLYKSDKTGQVIHKNMTVFAYPARWKYNVLRAMDYFRWAGRPLDDRMTDALDLIENKARKGKWYLGAKHAGKSHLTLEDSRRPSRMVSLIALRVLKSYRPEKYETFL